MDNAQEYDKANIDSKIKEAEIYRSMGLFSESIDVYEKILSAVSDLDSRTMEKIHKEMGYLKKELADVEEQESENLTSEDLSVIKKTLAFSENISTTLDSASAFKELGLYGQAVSEFERLFQLDYPFHKITPEILECLLKTYEPAEATDKIKEIINRQKLGNREKGEIIFLFGRDMENIGHKGPAFKFFKYGLQLDPENQKIKDKIISTSPVPASRSKYEHIINKKMITAEQLKTALSTAKKLKKSVEFILIQNFNIKKDEVGKSLSLFYGCPFKTYTTDIPVPVELLGNLKKSFQLNSLWVPLGFDKKGIEILIDDPNDLNKTDSIRKLLKTKKIILNVGIKEDIEAYIKRFFSDKEFLASDEPDKVNALTEDMDDFIPDMSFEEEETHDDETELSEASGKVVTLVDHLIVNAYRKNASDIHVEPSVITKNTAIRFRIDGLCQDYIRLPNSMAKGVISRLKIMAGLDIAEKRLPQDGKIKFKRRGIPAFELRIATYPTAEGFEDAVLRILPNAGAMKMEEMWLSERDLKVLKKVLSQPYGLILAVGPTGSGKTTSLHAILRYLNRPELKILTAEDPVEITQAGLRQVEVKPKIGLDFARVMRGFLRSDPDVIMIGEMRDEETADIGIEASLTGHLVLSTLHTNSAPETITRLLDMGLNPINFSDAFLCVLAQRLVRRLCTKCKEEYHPSIDEFNEIVHDYGEEFFENSGIKYTPNLTLYRAAGCEACSNLGYKGRLAIHELMEGTPEIKLLIKTQATTESIFKEAIKQGMKTLVQDGILKVFQGISDMKEVRRVCLSKT
ncbi:MAG TPA: GspE/PulE family protein [Desulfobacteraceae bacterium]|nr:GspE/PulE family protein [Desulfobacteraceae bacterium]HPJ67187.1 GspE/PulE family protein [Desulfobacteraceae bacterium]HPQ26847.1 GspE/PulE family protein [Desulfobacteraceae bacterium]